MNVMEKLVELLLQEDDVCEPSECKYCGVKGSCGYYRTADSLIANGVTVQKWIPVNSPPKKPGEYLCYFKYEPESPNIICQNTYYGSGRWMSESDKVTHWAQLPEPPKGE